MWINVFFMYWLSYRIRWLSIADEVALSERNTQQEVIDIFQSLDNRRLLVSAPTSYGKTFLMREIVFLNKERYDNILLVFPTVALLLENA